MTGMKVVVSGWSWETDGMQVGPSKFGFRWVFKKGTIYKGLRTLQGESAGPAREGSRTGERKELFLESGMRCVVEGVSVCLLEELWPS